MSDYAEGGAIHGPRDPGDDSVLIQLSPGSNCLPPRGMTAEQRRELLEAMIHLMDPGDDDIDRDS